MLWFSSSLLAVKSLFLHTIFPSFPPASPGAKTPYSLNSRRVVLKEKPLRGRAPCGPTGFLLPALRWPRHTPPGQRPACFWGRDLSVALSKKTPAPTPSPFALRTGRTGAVAWCFFCSGCGKPRKNQQLLSSFWEMWSFGVSRQQEKGGRKRSTPCGE
jgi:hypothetical protein